MVKCLKKDIRRLLKVSQTTTVVLTVVTCYSGGPITF